MATEVKVPALGESVVSAVLIHWHKQDGDAVSMDEPLCELETDKANVDVPSPGAGVLHRLKQEGDTVAVGEAIASIDATGKPAKPAAQQAAPAKAPSAAAPAAAAPAAPGGTAVSGSSSDLSPAVRRLVEENQLDVRQIKGGGSKGRITKEDVLNHMAKSSSSAAPTAPATPASAAAAPAPLPTFNRASERAAEPRIAHDENPSDFDANGERREPMTKIRRRIAETLVNAQQTAAILTTYNEVDLTEIIALRGKYKQQFEKIHGIGLGFMSFFSRAVVQCLKETPRVNAFIDNGDVVYHNYVNLGIAVSTERGLAVPVVRNVQDMSFAKIESEIKRVATAVRDGKLGLQDLSGATFTITNGGVFGSLLSMPILMPPQSGILGMHTIQKRPVVIDDKIEIRSMMYLALSYDHRLVDGKEAIGFLVRLKQLLEDPARLMLEV
jgi:2-oxoglutarate dehydrogenase E2 component (dihydrolipoamide succinyltransferase)